ncbi:MAG: hypothetical protein UW30_C0002G0049 [Candidatus Giovannonibacteria bacterium GW2011_GWA2_44_13b]|uniref:Sphingomyelin synthase-like domain-containing protein n=2 Tax=Candidatus Giovannoniibacteriota TaxID=1752738 RepID=A0A0G1H6N7_9BACT|nr:MAG: hypothetical protein UW30_C0002G0049 [Candidatus Giovannonibacteria bacterium GW2011_GWA2_44_13b]OGF81607.1 MAG: hypothetical protein A2924_02580 [Candidatus Giovannonibacteria bacterium RIFCSPLOWO2_01_FULL_44_16]
MKGFARKYLDFFREGENVWSVFLSILTLSVSIVTNYYAGIYATEKASNVVTDVILSNTQVRDIDGLFIYGTLLFWIFVTYLCMAEPKRISFVLRSIALFILIRSVFINLTHIGPFPDQIYIDSKIVNKFVFGGDLFFSGHTGLPFLLALIFWKNIYLRIFFILSSIVFGVIVLLAHLHYSIDVLSAFFITYSIYRIAEIVFAKEKKMFDS